MSEISLKFNLSGKELQLDKVLYVVADGVIAEIDSLGTVLFGHCDEVALRRSGLELSPEVGIYRGVHFQRLEQIDNGE